MGVPLLALDTSTTRAALALSMADGRTLVAPPDTATRHGRGLIPAIRALLAEGGLRVADLGGIAVGLGPGSYTGLRVGLMAAKTLAYAARLPLVGLDSLELVARGSAEEAVAVSADAQRGDRHVAIFRRDPDGTLRRDGPTRILTAAECPADIATLDPAIHPPETLALAALARERFEAGDRIDPMTAEPIYARRSAAEDQWTPRARPNPAK